MSVRISSLALEGFKSFAGKVELAFPGNIIAIVGPNGAGKSNICDAIAWVLGEQSARLLRSQTMGDVIFAGSAQRPPAAAAQVTLILDSHPGHPDHRLEISRRILRDGTSEYRLGGRRVRLKDIQDKLAEAGLGTRAYAIIEQGRVSQVLSAKPTDRRALFEEAAGISHYRLRRHEAELKLAETKANLERVSDIVAEVKREYGSIRRQARQAQRHAQLREELQRVTTLLAVLRWAEAKGKLEALQQEVAAGEAQHAQKAAALAQVEAELLRIQRQWEEKAGELANLREEQARVAGQCQRLEAEEAACRRELDTLRSRQEQVAALLAQTEGQIQEEQLRQQELTQKLAQAEEEVGKVREETVLREEAAKEAEKLAREAEAQAEEARQKLLRAVAAASEARNRFHRLQLEVEQIRYQQTRLSAERERLSQHLQQAASEEQEASQRERECQAELEQVQAQQQLLQALVDQDRKELKELAEKRDELEHRLWQVRHEREAVQRARAQLRALPQSLAKVLSDQQLAGTVADYLNPPPELAQTLDQAYGELLTLPVVQGEEAVERLLKASFSGEAVEVVIRDPQRLPPQGSLLSEAGALPQELGWLASALPPLALAQDPEEARRLATENPSLLVLLPGGSRRQGQRLRLGNGQRGPAGALHLKTREQELSALETQLAEEKQKLLALVQAKTTTFREHEHKLAELSKVVRQKTEALAEASSRREARHRERTRLERELEALAVEASRLEGELAKAQENLAHAQAQAKVLEERAEGESARVDEATAAASAARSQASQAHTEAEKWRGQLALALERQRFAQRELSQHRQLAEKLAQEAKRLRQELLELSQRQSQLQELLAQTRTQLEEALKLSALGQQKAGDVEAQVAQLKEQVEQQQHQAARAREEEQAALKALVDAQLRAAELAAELSHLQEALGGQPPEEIPQDVDRDALGQRQKELEQQLAQLGPVNELAVQQEKELEERFRFLSAQKKDLEESLESLRKSITELDTTCQERFLATLSAANELFGEVFRELFGGGEAQVLLSDPESPLDSGIEVKVRPPGKHTQSVLLLSGGEKALAAVALLLALFRIRPAPFCVLDEVDAPLDDLNVERLCQHLKAQAQQTQFLLITHNRRTMAHADVLYGVTMEEPGVSRVVSVRLEEA